MIVNVFGGPGSGKSTTAAGLFHWLKCDNINCELVHEEAKKHTWMGAKLALECQPYIFGKQLMKLWRVKDKVDIVITDSPILLSCIYGEDWGPQFRDSCLHIFRQFNNQNFLLTRVKPYSIVGRNQTEQEAVEIDQKIERFLLDFGVPYTRIEGDGDARSKIWAELTGILRKKT